MAKNIGGGYVINSLKMWISSTPIADILIVWAKSEKWYDKIKVFIFKKARKVFPNKNW